MGFGDAQKYVKGIRNRSGTVMQGRSRAQGLARVTPSELSPSDSGNAKQAQAREVSDSVIDLENPGMMPESPPKEESEFPYIIVAGVVGAILLAILVWLAFFRGGSSDDGTKASARDAAFSAADSDTPSPYTKYAFGGVVIGAGALGGFSGASHPYLLGIMGVVGLVCAIDQWFPRYTARIKSWFGSKATSKKTASETNDSKNDPAAPKKKAEDSQKGPAAPPKDPAAPPKDPAAPPKGAEDPKEDPAAADDPKKTGGTDTKIPDPAGKNIFEEPTYNIPGLIYGNEELCQNEIMYLKKSPTAPSETAEPPAEAPKPAAADQKAPAEGQTPPAGGQTPPAKGQTPPAEGKKICGGRHDAS